MYLSDIFCGMCTKLYQVCKFGGIFLSEVELLWSVFLYLAIKGKIIEALASLCFYD